MRPYWAQQTRHRCCVEIDIQEHTFLGILFNHIIEGDKINHKIDTVEYLDSSWKETRISIGTMQNTYEIKEDSYEIFVNK